MTNRHVFAGKFHPLQSVRGRNDMFRNRIFDEKHLFMGKRRTPRTFCLELAQFRRAAADTYTMGPMRAADYAELRAARFRNPSGNALIVHEAMVLKLFDVLRISESGSSTK